MMTHPAESQINDYVDDLLEPAEAAAIAAHVAECAHCALEIERLTALKNSLAQLPRAIRPPRDLRAGIRESVGGARGRVLWSLRVPLAAAAVLLIAFGSIVTLAVMNSRRGGDVAQRDRPEVRLVARAARLLEREYAEEVRELELVLRKSRGALSAETVRILEENLAIIDRAIGEAQRALAADPNSGMLVDLLRSAYERKIDLLRQAAKSSPAT
ncbi:MAG: zf-HC2 domain-containing protein [Gemmatimonadota bacterium]